MATFTGNIDVPALDLVTVISILEHCDLEETMAHTFTCHPYNGILREEWLCLRCLCHKASRHTVTDGRAELIDAVRHYGVMILKIEPRGAEHPCNRCGHLRHLTPPIVPNGQS